MLFPERHCAVEGTQDAADLFGSGFGESAAVLAVKFLNLCASELEVSEAAAGIEPEFQALGRIARSLN